MDSREAGATEAPTARGISLVDHLRGVLLAGGRHEATEQRAERMYREIEANRDGVTMTLMLMMAAGDPITYLLNNALMGQRWNKDLERDELGSAPPLFDVIELQSLRVKCPQCDGNKCGRKGKFHDIVYKTGLYPRTGAQHNLAVAMGGTVERNVQCKVDPETGLFSLPPTEAVKALRQWGEFAVRATRRWSDKINKKGDRWLVREVNHHRQYSNASLYFDGTTKQDVQPMTAL